MTWLDSLLDLVLKTLSKHFFLFVRHTLLLTLIHAKLASWHMWAKAERTRNIYCSRVLSNVHLIYWNSDQCLHCIRTLGDGNDCPWYYPLTTCFCKWTKKTLTYGTCVLSFSYLFSMSWRTPVFVTTTSPCQRRLQPLALHQHLRCSVLFRMRQSLRALKAHLPSSMLSWISSRTLGG